MHFTGEALSVSKVNDPNDVQKIFFKTSLPHYNFKWIQDAFQSRNRLYIPPNYLLPHISLAKKLGQTIHLSFGEDIVQDRIPVYCCSRNDQCLIVSNFGSILACDNADTQTHQLNSEAQRQLQQMPRVNYISSNLPGTSSSNQPCCSMPANNNSETAQGATPNQPAITITCQEDQPQDENLDLSNIILTKEDVPSLPEPGPKLLGHKLSPRQEITLSNRILSVSMEEPGNPLKARNPLPQSKEKDTAKVRQEKDVNEKQLMTSDSIIKPATLNSMKNGNPN